MLKRTGLIVLTFFLVAGGTLFQQKVLQVNAAVQVLLVSRTAIAFGDVFPGENSAQTYTVQLDTSANSATYVTTLTPLPGLQNLCPFLNVLSIDSPAEPDTLANATLKRPGDVLDNWQVQFNVPGIQGQLSQNHTGGIIVQGGNFGCQITVTTTSDPGQIIICKQSVGGTGSFNYTGDLGNFSIQTSLSGQNKDDGQNDPCGNQTNPCGNGQTLSQTADRGGSVLDITKCITNTTVTNSNNSVITNIVTSGSSSGGNVIASGNGGINNSVIVTGNSSSNSSVNTTANIIDSTVTTGGSSGSGEKVFSNLQSGNYSVTESSSTNWTLTSLVCKDPSNNSIVSQNTAKISLDSGETVVCTFTNKKTGTIIIHKKTGDDSDSCNFSGALGNFSVPTHQGAGSQTFSNLDSGSYSVTENAKGGWSPSSISCTGGAYSVTGGGTKINLSAGQTVDCTFTNIKKK